MERPDRVLERFGNLEGKHLLDFFRLSFIPPPPPQQKPRRIGGDELLELIPCAKKLDAAGIEFKPKKGDTVLAIRFHNGVLEIPHISIDDFITAFLLNSVAFEQCYSDCPKHMTAYATFMGCLINNLVTRAEFLCEQKIVENYFGTADDLTHFFNNLGKEVSFDIGNNYLSNVFVDVRWAEFKDTYFNSPWSFISALAASILLLLTMIQAFFDVYPFAGGKPFGS